MYDVFKDKDRDLEKAYTDVEEWRDAPVRHLYVHGGMKGCGLKFSFYFPPKEQYQGRFFHYVAPAHGLETASQVVHGELDRISFAITHGGYFVESNMGGESAAGEELLKNSAVSAVYSRIVAQRLYGEHRPYGYIYGGSGGSLKTCACFENTQNVWDGAVPFVIGSPWAMPNTFTVRAHALRLLRHKLPQIIDAVEPGGSGDMYAGLNTEERLALEEATKMGFPPRSWFAHTFIGDGALPLLTPAVNHADPTYYKDFWTLTGYLGSDPEGSASRDRIQFTTRLTAINIPEQISPEDFTNTGVDDAWHIYQNLDRFVSPPTLELEEVPQGDLYLHGINVVFENGEAKGQCLPLASLDGNVVTIGETFQRELYRLLSGLRLGDEVTLDNSDYIALQTYHRHQVPQGEAAGYRQFKDAEGNPIYPQREMVTGPLMAHNGSGALQTGYFQGKMIVLASLMDESAFPWLADWYRNLVHENLGDDENEHLRIWYMDHAMHCEVEYPQSKRHVVGYLGALHQALVDLSAWVEKGIDPPRSTCYTENDAQIIIPADADQRLGIQPVVTLHTNGAESTRVKVGQTIQLEGTIKVPYTTGKVCNAQWDFEEEGTFGTPAVLVYNNPEQTAASTKIDYSFSKPGTYFPVLRATSNRNENDPFTNIRNLARVRVVVTE